MTKIDIFDKALDIHGLTKKYFAHKVHIPYDTVVGWKRIGKIPEYAFMLLKKLVNDEQLKVKKEKRVITPKINERLIKRVEVAFWGKNYDMVDIVKKARRGNKKYFKIILTNIWIKDALQLLGPKAVLKNLEAVKGEIPQNKYDTYLYIARKNI